MQLYCSKMEFPAMVEEKPKSEIDRFVFLMNSRNNAYALRECGFKALVISGEVNQYDYTMKSFSEEKAFQNIYEGWLQEYAFVLCLDWKSNKELKQFFDDLEIRVVQGYKLFKPEEDLSIADKAKLKNEVIRFIDSVNRFKNITENKTLADINEIVDILRTLHAEKYEASDRGFSKLFSDVFSGMHRYNPSRRDFMYFDGKRWVNDTEGLKARSSAKLLSSALVRYATELEDDGRFLKLVYPLSSLKNRNNMINDSKDILFFTNELLDKNDYQLNVQNGVLDLTGEEVDFVPHSPDFLLSKICNVCYEPESDCPTWNKFLTEIMQGNEEKVKYLQKIAGLSLIGDTREETCFILYGSTTRNGKSSFIETLLFLLGDYGVTMKPESLAVKQNADSRTANGDIARLAGCRLCNASEPPKRMLFDTALLKSLLGRDSITARHLHEREFTFIPKFKLVMNTNYLPTITDDTIFSSGRINIITFDRHFEPDEQDKGLKDKLRNPKELSGILNWCIDGLRLYRAEGLTPPQAVQDATKAYRSDSDKLGNFILECLVESNRNSKAKDIYDCYSQWCSDCGQGCESKSNFFAELKAKGIFLPMGTVDGKTVKNVVKGYVIESEFVECSDAEASLFE